MREDPILEHFYSFFEERVDDMPDWSIFRQMKDGWFIVKGPICNFFMGQAESAGMDDRLVFGPVVRRTEVSGSDREDLEEKFHYRLRETNRVRLPETPLAVSSQGMDAVNYVRDLHEQVVASLDSNDLLYDGWIIWG